MAPGEQDVTPRDLAIALALALILWIVIGAALVHWI
jgi:hypothetical protein